jgi:hypothetical protein
MAQAILNYVGVRMELAIETQIYRPKDTPAIVSQILELQGVAGAIVGHSYAAKGYTPSEWKGTVPGDILTERVRKFLGPLEVWESKGASVDHNTLDAVGLGLFHSGRAKRGIVK